MASVVSNLLLKWVPDFSSCHKICPCNPWVTRVKFVLVFAGNLKVNLQTLEVLVFSKTIRDISLPKLTLLDGRRGHFLWRDLFYTHLPFVCLFSGGAGGVTEPTSSLPAVKITFLTITEKKSPWNYFRFKPWNINYFSQIESFLEYLYPSFALHSADLYICTREFIDLAHWISLCRGLGTWLGGREPMPSCRSPDSSSAAAPGWEVLLSPLSPWHKHMFSSTCLTPNQTPWQNWELHCTPCTPSLEGRAEGINYKWHVLDVVQTTWLVDTLIKSIIYTNNEYKYVV